MRGHFKPPPYHIAAAMSKHATDFNSRTRHSTADYNDSNRQECDSVSEAETTSTAPSSLQTVLRGPGNFGNYSYGVSETETDASPPSTPTDPQQFNSESFRRFMAENKSAVQFPGKPDSQPAKLSKEQLQKLENSGGIKPESDVESMQNHAQKLRKVSEQLLGGGSSRSRQSFTGIPSPGITKIPTSSRPSSRISHMGDSSFGTAGRDSPFGNIAGRDLRPSSYAGPQNTIGLPAQLNTSLNDTKIPKLNIGSKKNSITQPPDNGLLSTIERAAHSDDESSPPPLPMKDDLRKMSAPPVMQSPLAITRYPISF